MKNQDKVKNLIDLRVQAKLGGGESVLSRNMQKANLQRAKEFTCCWMMEVLRSWICL